MSFYKLPEPSMSFCKLLWVQWIITRTLNTKLTTNYAQRYANNWSCFPKLWGYPVSIPMKLKSRATPPKLYMAVSVPGNWVVSWQAGPGAPPVTRPAVGSHSPTSPALSSKISRSVAAQAHWVISPFCGFYWESFFISIFWLYYRPTSCATQPSVLTKDPLPALSSILLAQFTRITNSKIKFRCGLQCSE